MAGQRCWFAGKASPKEAFAVRPSIDRNAAIPRQAPRYTPEPVPSPSYQDMENDAYVALCGLPCPLLEPFNNRWRLQ